MWFLRLNLLRNLANKIGGDCQRREIRYFWSLEVKVVKSLGTLELIEKIFHARTFLDRFEFPVSVRVVFFRFNFEDTPLPENHLGLKKDSESLKGFREIISNPQSPRLKDLAVTFPFSASTYQDSNRDNTELNQPKIPAKSRPHYSPEGL